jgi:hypothetical protein
MAAPNIVNVANITAKTAASTLSTTMANVIINLASSSTVVKINDVILTNYGSSNIAANVLINRSSTNYWIGANIVVPGYSTLVLIGKDSFLYLEEGDLLQANTASNNSMTCLSAYEIIS